MVEEPMIWSKYTHNPRKKTLRRMADEHVSAVLLADPSLPKTQVVEVAFRNAAAEDPALWSKWSAFVVEAIKSYDARNLGRTGDP